MYFIHSGASTLCMRCFYVFYTWYIHTYIHHSYKKTINYEGAPQIPIMRGPTLLWFFRKSYGATTFMGFPFYGGAAPPETHKYGFLGATYLYLSLSFSGFTLTSVNWFIANIRTLVHIRHQIQYRMVNGYDLKLQERTQLLM